MAFRIKVNLLFVILGTTMSINVATQEGDHGCYHYLLIYAIKPNLEKYLSNMNEFNFMCYFFISKICNQTVSQLVS